MGGKKWIQLWIFIVFSLFFLIAVLNFIIDPGKIYLNKIISDFKANKYTQELLNSKYGLIQAGWNERLVKTTLAKTTNADCYVVGSSHVMQISYLRNTGNIQKECSNLINLGVSGAGLEDVSIMSYLLLNRFKKPKKVYLGIDPWDLKFGMDSRYGMYENYLKEMNKIISNYNSGENTSYIVKYILNLFNREYTLKSFDRFIELLSKNDKHNDLNLFDKNIKLVKNNFEYENGTDEAVTLQDGSHVYKNSWIIAQREKIDKVPFGGGNYKINGLPYNDDAIEYLLNIIKLYHLNGVDVEFIMTPYHPNVFKKGMTTEVKYFYEVENKIHLIAKEMKIDVYGSYDPRNVGCLENEFFDFMHPTNDCLNRINF